jgi:hypothetical protein
VSPRARKEIVRPRLQSGVSIRPLNFTVRTQMQGSWTRRDKAASVVMGTFGTALLAWAVASVYTSPSYITLWLLGCALGTFSSAFSPQRLFRRFTFSMPDTRLPRGARICASLGGVCLMLALILWLARAG